MLPYTTLFGKRRTGHFLCTFKLPNPRSLKVGFTTLKKPCFFPISCSCCNLFLATLMVNVDKSIRHGAHYSWNSWKVHGFVLLTVWEHHDNNVQTHTFDTIYDTHSCVIQNNLYLFLFQVSMNPFYDTNRKIESPHFERKVMIAAKKHLMP